MSNALISLALIGTFSSTTALASEAVLESTEIEILLEADDADIDLDDPNLLDLDRSNMIDLGGYYIEDLDGPIEPTLDLASGRSQRNGWGVVGAVSGSLLGTLAGAVTASALEGKTNSGAAFLLLPVFTITGAATGSYLANGGGFGRGLLGASGGLACGLPLMGIGSLVAVIGALGGSPTIGIAGAAVVAGTYILAPAVGALVMGSGLGRRVHRVRLGATMLESDDGLVPGAAVALAW